MVDRTEQKFGAELRRLRQAANLTQEELAERAGVSARAISDLERGVKHLPRKDTARMLADGLGLSGLERQEFLSASRRPVSSHHAQAPPNRWGPLPRPPSELIGRASEVSELVGLVSTEAVQMVTLLGPGGVGKTRLALEIAQLVLPRFRDGVAWIELAPLADVTFVPTRIAHAVGLLDIGNRDPIDAIETQIGTGQVLLVLDNVEHLLGVSPLIAKLLERCPALTVLATSRAPLRLRAERRVSVPPLALPKEALGHAAEAFEEVPAVSFFFDRARAVVPGFSLDPAAAPALATLLRRLDGLPLAIELAAARVDVLSVATIAQQLDEVPVHLAIPFDGPWVDAPARHRSLSAAIGWSYDLLMPKEQALFRQLAAFHGGWDLDAMAAIGEIAADAEAEAEIVGLIGRLTDASLVQHLDAPLDRFGMLDTVRAFGSAQLEALGELGEARARHAAYFSRLATEAEVRLSGADQGSWQERLETELPNLRAACVWYVEHGDGVSVLELVCPLTRFWLLRGFQAEGRHWVEQGLARVSDAPPPLLANARFLLGDVLFDLGDMLGAAEQYEVSRTIWTNLGDRAGLARALTALGVIAANSNELVHARQLHEDALAIWRELNDERGIARSLYNLGTIARNEGDDERALDVLRSALASWESIGDIAVIAYLRWTIGNVHRFRGENGESAEQLTASLDAFRVAGDRLGEGLALTELGLVALRLGSAAGAARHQQAALDVRQHMGYEPGIIDCVEGCAAIAAHQGFVADAGFLCGAATAARASTGAGFTSPRHGAEFTAMMATTRAMDDAAWKRGWKQGQAATLSDAVAAARLMIARMERS